MEFLQEIFLFNQDAPLIFTRFYFWAFFAVAMAIYLVLYKKIAARNIYLFAISLFFYYKTSGFYFFLLIFSTIVDYFIGYGIYKSDKKLLRKILLTLSIIVNLFVLSYFKYSYFFVDTLNYMLGTNFEVIDVLAKWSNNFAGSHFDIDRIILPVGISFFTFQTISYSIDIYRGKVKPVKNILDFGFYVSFFPQLVAGPIVRASEFVPQLYEKFKLTRAEFGIAVFMILNGLLKKMFVSDYISVNFIDRVFANPRVFSGFENLMALYGYSIQVYADFSGYTDIAIGVALLMGFRLPINFNSPYKAQHVGEFWKRWHISLSTWLKDYLYIPMGGNRGGSIFTYTFVAAILASSVLIPSWSILNFVILIVLYILWFVNSKYKKFEWLNYLTLLSFGAFIALLIIDKSWFGVFTFSFVLFFWILAILVPRVKVIIDNNINLMITMLIGGLWHGASWQFVIWGGLNGVGLVIYKFWRKISPFTGNKSWAAKILAVFITFNFITFTRIWFRSESMEVANGVMYQIANSFNFAQIGEVVVSYYKIFAMIIFAYIIHWLPSSFKQKYKNWFINTPHWLKVIIIIIVIFLIYQVSSAELQPFIYFQF